MRISLILLLSVVLFTAPCAAQTQQQKKEVEQIASVTSFGATYNNAVGAGNGLFAFLRLGSGTASGVTVSDNVNSGNWTQAFAALDSTNGRSLYLFYRENAASGTPTVMASWTGSAGQDELDIYEYSGMATSSSIDGNNSACPAATTTPNSGNITTTNAADLLLGGLTFSSSGTTTVSAEASSFTQQLNNTIGTANHPHLHSADRSVTSTGTYNYQPTLSASVTTCVGIAAFKAAAASGPPHQLTTLGCCGIALVIDGTNLLAFPECAPEDTGCKQGVSVCLPDPIDGADRCFDLPAGGSPARFRLWKQTATQRLTSPVGVLLATGPGRGMVLQMQPGPPLP